MRYSMLRRFRVHHRKVAGLCATLAACAIPAAALAAALPAPPQTFDSSYLAPTGTVVKVSAGGNLQTALNNAKLGDTIVLEAGATFKGPFKLPNKTTGTGWIYVVSSHLSSLPAPGTRVSPANAVNMPKILAPNALSALNTVAGSHHFRFVGIEFAPAAGTTQIYEVIAIGNSDTSTSTLAHHIVFDRCYVHGTAGSSDRRGIEMDGAYVAVVDSYLSSFQDNSAIADSQGLWAYNTSGPLQIRNNYIEAATENVMFGGADSRAATLVPTSIEIRGNHFYKPLSLISTHYAVKNLLELKTARRLLITGNTFENSPAKSQAGTAVVITPRNGGKAPWSVTSDIAIVDNIFINVGSGFGIAGHDSLPTLLTARILVRDNLVQVTGLNGAAGRAFQFVDGGSDYTITHNTIINTALPPATPDSHVVMADTASNRVSNFVFTNNLVTLTSYGFSASGLGEGTRSLNGDFTSWTFSRNVLVGRPAAAYPAANYFPANVAAVRFANYAGGNYALAADSPYKGAGTDGADIGATPVP
ncbi:MAG: right-handed parallel beta-helix repeat-containing protein [Gammaproteobacteria bacterium]|nr:right-handed parallel beta-helix repeat-containing protein [Gammaproteobacteria bacterium]